MHLPPPHKSYQIVLLLFDLLVRCSVQNVHIVSRYSLVPPTTHLQPSHAFKLPNLFFPFLKGTVWSSWTASNTLCCQSHGTVNHDERKFACFHTDRLNPLLLMEKLVAPMALDCVNMLVDYIHVCILILFSDGANNNCGNLPFLEKETISCRPKRCA